MKTIAMVLLIAFILLPARTAACSCVPLELQNPAEDHDVIFTGRVTNIEQVIPRKQVNSVTLSVSRNYKAAPNPEIVVYTARNTESCGFAFEMGTEYAVFARIAGNTAPLMSVIVVEDAPNVNRCGPTNRLEPDAAELRRRNVMEILETLE